MELNPGSFFRNHFGFMFYTLKRLEACSGEMIKEKILAPIPQLLRHIYNECVETLPDNKE